MVDVALRTVKEVVIAKQGNVTSQTLLDYGTALYLTGETALAKAAVTRVLSMPATDPATRRLARLIRLSIAQSSNNIKEAESLRAGIREEDTDLCKTTELDPEQYWPYALHENVQAMLTQICSEPTE